MLAQMVLITPEAQGRREWGYMGAASGCCSSGGLTSALPSIKNQTRQSALGNKILGWLIKGPLMLFNPFQVTVSIKITWGLSRGQSRAWLIAATPDTPLLSVPSNLGPSFALFQTWAVNAFERSPGQSKLRYQGEATLSQSPVLLRSWAQ